MARRRMGHYPIFGSSRLSAQPKGVKNSCGASEPGRSFFGNGFPQLIVDELG